MYNIQNNLAQVPAPVYYLNEVDVEGFAVFVQPAIPCVRNMFNLNLPTTPVRGTMLTTINMLNDRVAKKAALLPATPAIMFI